MTKLYTDLEKEVVNKISVKAISESAQLLIHNGTVIGREINNKTEEN